MTGKVTPKDAVKEVTLEVQKTPGGTWGAWQWFESKSDGMGSIVATVSQTTGNYTLKYLAPGNISAQTTRLRIHGHKFSTKVDVVSASWYVTKPAGC